jgi:hypothetical protein
VARVLGFTFITIDCEPAYAAWWNRWYDLDHLPEFLACDGVVATRRYRATAELVAARPPTTVADLADGRGEYCTSAAVGPDEDRAAAGRAAMAAVHDRLMPVPGRMPDWDRIAPRFIEGYDVVAARPGPGVPVATDALAHLAHRGILVELHDIDAASGAAAGDAGDADDPAGDALLAAPGVLARLRTVPHTLPPVEAPWLDGAAEGDGPAAPRPVPQLDLYLLAPDPAELLSVLAEASAPTAATRRFHGTWRTINGLDVSG